MMENRKLNNITINRKTSEIEIFFPLSFVPSRMEIQNGTGSSAWKNSMGRSLIGRAISQQQPQSKLKVHFVVLLQVQPIEVD
jgi:hypothetical protein